MFSGVPGQNPEKSRTPKKNSSPNQETPNEEYQKKKMPNETPKNHGKTLAKKMIFSNNWIIPMNVFFFISVLDVRRFSLFMLTRLILNYKYHIC